MFVSHFETTSHSFLCQNVKCRNVFEVPLRRLLEVDRVVCPACGQRIGIEESKKKGAVRKDFDEAERLDIEARRKEKQE